MKKFNNEFIFSTSTNSFQIEGGRNIGGRTPSIWDEFTNNNFYIPPSGSNEREINSIKVAADFYHKYKLDIKIMKDLGVNGFVYNLDWSRIISHKDAINQEGLEWTIDFFKELVKNGIKPIPIIFHWDTPMWLEKLGGVTGKEFLNSFRYFTKVLYKHLGKYTDIWFVNDENSSFTMSGYMDDYYPPGKNNKKETFIALHQLNMSAAIAKEEFLKAKDNKFIEKKAMLGIDHDWSPAIPYDLNNSEDLNKVNEFNEYNLKMYLDPNLLGKYPKVFMDEIKALDLNDLITENDLSYLKKYTLDLIGWNYYRPTYVTSQQTIDKKIEWKKEPGKYFGDVYICYPKDVEYTSWNWIIDSSMIVPGSKVLQKRYGKPLMIIENGIGAFENIDGGKIIQDNYRIDYLNNHLREVQKAISQGVNFIGYSLWTYCDIFSPSGGYRKRYGLVGVDFESPNLDRYPKASYFWYQDVINKKTTFDDAAIDYKKYYKK